ncbi:MAG: TonB-dependent receptor [Pirellulales bacterium]|nr:TonB-dependent receptor [Pirellulales bacterium]
MRGSFTLATALVCLLLPGVTAAQQFTTAPSPPAYYTALALQDGPTEQQAEAAVGKEDEKGDLDFLDKSLSEISQTQVTSPALSSEIDTVSRTTQPLARTAAAVYVVTNEMIKRSGARNIPEVLRTVPGVQVARINASAWAISIRGFNSHFAKDLLVQIDGVAIYSPTHSGVFWEREYVMLEDVDRIEVIRGPGAAVWGVNAVNGVINIVTKSSKDTKGAYVDGGGGNEHLQFGHIRVGGQVGNLSWRMYGMNMRDETGYMWLPYIAEDAPRMNQGGFRADWTPTRSDTITIQGDFYRGKDNLNAYPVEPYWPAYRMNCGTTTLLTRWARQIDEDTDWAMQLYYWNPFADGYNVNNVSTFDLDWQYHFKRGRHDVVWGFGYRNANELWADGGGSYNLHDTEQIPSYFVQDTITLVEDRFFVTLGSKFDHNSVTDFEYQPTVRVAWTPDERTSIWGAISRAARTPSLIERITMTPNAEHVLSYEAGIRRQPNDRLFWELATFFSRYDGLLGDQSYDRVYGNVGRADSYGVELNGTYEVNERWHLTAWYTFLVENPEFLAGYSPTFYVGSSPRNQVYLQSSWDLGSNISLDAMFRYTDMLAIETPWAGVQKIPNYFTADIRLAWRPRTNWELSVVGQNLLCGNHAEFTYDGGSWATEVEPGVYGMISWQY